MFLLDTDIVPDLVRHPRGLVANRIRRVGERQVCTSIIVAAELRYGAAKTRSARLTAQLETVLGALDIFPFRPPADIAYMAISGPISNAKVHRLAATICRSPRRPLPGAIRLLQTTRESSRALTDYAM